MIARLKRFIAALVLALGGCAAAHAAWLYDGGDAKAVFADVACADPAILERVKPEYQKNFKQGVVLADGQRISICWLEKDGAVHFIAAEGLPGAVPVEALRRAQSI